MDLGVRGRVAMVAASSKGLGHAVAVALAKEGCRLSICSRSPESLQRAEQLILQQVPEAELLCVPTDVSRAEEIVVWHSRTLERFAAMDILVTNTGGPPAGRFLQLGEEEWRAAVDATLMSVVRMCRLVIPGMQAQRWGRIVHLTSFVAKQPVEMLTVSSTLRAGLSALTKTMATQVAPDNVLVNAVLPGHFLTDRQVQLTALRAKEAGVSPQLQAQQVEATIPMRRYGRPDELANVVAFLCSERASYLTGTSLQVDGGVVQATF